MTHNSRDRLFGEIYGVRRDLHANHRRGFFSLILNQEEEAVVVRGLRAGRVRDCSAREAVGPAEHPAAVAPDPWRQDLAGLFPRLAPLGSIAGRTARSRPTGQR